ncbi:BRCT domain-containing protein [Solwaraspora sp. WMMB335]|uniref:BRCT domain-containing protein n=1 Tax=Solwaraspora sp. WMMB335 TaxID=3404118 RepID=UPI003B951810
MAADSATAGRPAYLELLAQVLEDGVLTKDEAAALADLAGAYSLTRTQVEAAHRGFLLALARRAVGDGTVTRAERRELITTAGHLGLPEKLVRTVLDDARAALDDQRGRLCRPLPPGWSHGEPLRLGDGVAFTGCDDLVRARLEGRAKTVGLRVTGSVSGRTAILVTDGSAPSTTKSAAAQRLGTRIVHPDVFAELIEYVQPATTPERSGGDATPAAGSAKGSPPTW